VRAEVGKKKKGKGNNLVVDFPFYYTIIFLLSNISFTTFYLSNHLMNEKHIPSISKEFADLHPPREDRAPIEETEQERNTMFSIPLRPVNHRLRKITSRGH
jgi:hypothetical protein